MAVLIFRIRHVVCIELLYLYSNIFSNWVSDSPKTIGCLWRRLLLSKLGELDVVYTALLSTYPGSLCSGYKMISVFPVTREWAVWMPQRIRWKSRIRSLLGAADVQDVDIISHLEVSGTKTALGGAVRRWRPPCGAFVFCHDCVLTNAESQSQDGGFEKLLKRICKRCLIRLET